MSQRPNVSLGRADRLMTWNSNMNIYRVNRFNPLADETPFKYRRYVEKRFDIIEALIDRNMFHVVEDIFDLVDPETLLYSAVLVCKCWNDFLSSSYLKRWAEKIIQVNASLKDLASKEKWLRYLNIGEGEEIMDEPNQDIYRKICSRIHQLQEIWRFREPKLRRLDCESFVLSCALISDRELFCGLNSGILQLWNLDWCGKVKERVIHDKGIKCLSIGDSLFASGSYDCTAKLWKLSDWSLLRTITVHSDSVWDLKLFKNCRLITAGLDGTIGVFDFNSITNDLSVVEIMQDHNDLVSAIDYTDDFLASGYEDSRIIVRVHESRNAFKVAGLLEGHNGGITGLKINDLRPLLASCSYDGTVRLWKLEDYSSIMIFTTHEHFVRCIKFKGNFMTSGDFGGIVHFWDLELGINSVSVKNHRKFTAHKSHIVCVDFNARKLITGSRDKTVLVQDFWGKMLETEYHRRKREKAALNKPTSRFLKR